MDTKMIERINELARKSKTPEGLTEAEKEERAKLRAAYLADFRAGLRQQLDSIVIEDEDGNRRKLEPKPRIVH